MKASLHKRIYKWVRDFFRDERAQVSAELLIVIAALVAVAVILVLQLQNTAKKGSKTIGEETEKAFREIGEITNSS